MYALKQTKSHDLLTSLNFNIYVLGGFLHLSCFVVKVLIVGCIIPPWYPKCTRLWYTSCIFFLSSFSQIRSACPKISSFQKFTRCRFHLLRRYPCKIKIIALLLNSLGRMDENSLSFTHLASMKGQESLDNWVDLLCPQMTRGCVAGTIGFYCHCEGGPKIIAEQA